jgi:TP901 family phage tail tape measure protein
MADKIQIPVEIRPHRFEEIKQQLNTILDPKTLSADAQILFQNVIGSLNIAQAEMTKQMAENKFNMPALNLKTIDKQMGSLIKKVQEDLGETLPEAFVEAQKELEILNNKMAANQRQQKQLIDDIKSTPSIADQAKSSSPAGFKKFGIAGDEAATAAKVLQLEKQISETKDKRKLGPLQAELEYQSKVLQIQRDTNQELEKKKGTLNQLQSAESSMAAMAEVQRDKQLEAMKNSKGTDASVNALLGERKKLNETIVQSIKFGQDYNAIKAKSADAEKRESKAIKGTSNSIAEKSIKTLGLNLVYQQLRKLLFGSIRTVRELDKALTDAAVVTGMTREQTWGLIGSYQELAKKTGLATSEIAGVVTQFLRQGRSLGDAMQLAEVAAKSAKVAGISAKEAVDFLTSAVNGFGLSANQAEDIADKFAAIAAKSATSFEELAKAMSKVSPTAKSAGVSVDFMMGVIAKGIETTREAPENIGTAFKTIFARMREVTDLGKSMEDGMNLNRVEKALLSVGVPLRNVSGQFRNLEHVLTDVGEKWDTLTSVEQAYLATALAGSRQQPRLLAIFNDFARTKELIQISSEATGGLQLQHMQYMTGMEASLSRLKTAWEGFITSIVSADIVVFFFEILQGAVEGVTTVIQAIGPSMSIMIGLVTAMGVAYALSSNHIANFLKTLKESAIYQGIYNKYLAFSNSLQAINNTIAVAKNHTDKISIIYSKRSVSALFTKLGVQATEQKMDIISALLMSKNNKERALGTKLLWQTIVVGKIKAAVDFLTATAQGVLNFMVGKGTVANYAYAKSLALATMGLSLLVPLIIGAVAAVVQFFNGAGKAAKGNSLLAKTLGPIGDAFKHLFDIFKSLFKIFFDLGKSLMGLVLFVGMFALAFSPIGLLLGKLYVGFRLITIVIKLVNVGIKVFTNLINSVIDGIVKFVQGIIDFIKNIPFIGDIIKGLESLITGFLNGVNTVDNALNDMNTSLGEFGQKANEATLKLNEFNKGAAGVKNLKKQYDELNKKASKTPEELQKMQDILKQMSEVEIDGQTFSFATEFDGQFSFNESAYAEALKIFEKRQQEMNTELNSLIDRSLRVYGTAGSAALQGTDRKGVFEEQGILDAARFLGQQYAKTFVTSLVEAEKIDDVFAMNLLKATNSAISSAGASFFNSFVQNGQFQEASLKNFVEGVVDKTKVSVENLNKELEKISLDKELNDRQKAIQAANKQREAYRLLEQQLKAIGGDAQDAVAIKVAAEFMGDGAILYDLVNLKGFSVDAIVNMQMTGKSLVQIQDLMVNEFDDIFQGISKRADAQLFTKAGVLNTFSKSIENAFSQTGNGVKIGLESYANLLKQAGYTGDEFEKKFLKFSNSISTLSAQATADLLEDQRKTSEKLFSLPDKLKKGDFKDYADLVSDFGIDAIQDFLGAGTDKNAAIASMLQNQTRKTLDGINSSISKIETNARVLGRELTLTEQQEISMLETMFEYYRDIVSVEQLRTYQLKEANDLLKESADLIKLQETLTKFGMSEESPILKTIDNLINKSQELAEQKAIETLQQDLDRLSAYGRFNQDGIFEFFNADTINATTAKTALDNYMGSLTTLANIQNQEYERQKKLVEERYKGEIDALKTSNDEKWKAIEYSDKLRDAEEKIAASRKALMGLALSGASSGMLQNAQKDLEKMKKERQKMIEQQMVEEAQKQLEKERDDAIQALGQQQVAAMQNLTGAITELTEVVRDNSAFVPSGSANPGGGGGSSGTGTSTTPTPTLGLVY